MFSGLSELNPTSRKEDVPSRANPGAGNVVNTKSTKNTKLLS